MKLNGTPHLIIPKKVVWQTVAREDGTFLAAPADEKPVKRYIIFNPSTRSAIYKEVGNPIGHTFEDCSSLKEAIERVMKL